MVSRRTTDLQTLKKCFPFHWDDYEEVVTVDLSSIVTSRYSLTTLTD